MKQIKTIHKLIDLLNTPYNKVTFYEKIGVCSDTGEPHYAEKEKMWFLDQNLLLMLIHFKGESKFYYKKHK